jgi:hypothetical protein
MDRKMALDHLATAEEAIALGDRHIAREEQMIADLDRAGHDTTLALAVLATYRQMQAQLVAHRNLLLNRLQLLQQHANANASARAAIVGLKLGVDQLR